MNGTDANDRNIESSKQKALSESEIADLLKFIRRVDNLFCPPLSSRTNLEAYLKKMLREGVVHYVKSLDSDQIDGLAGFYCTPVAYEYAFLTFIATSGDKRGVGSTLLISVTEYARRDGMFGVETQTWASNKRSLSMFERAGFKIQSIEKNRGAGQEPSILLRLEF